MSEGIMRKRENAQLVRINWDDSDVPRDISSRRYTQVFEALTPRLFSSNAMVCSVCIGRTGALQVRDVLARAHESSCWEFDVMVSC